MSTPRAADLGNLLGALRVHGLAPKVGLGHSSRRWFRHASPRVAMRGCRSDWAVRHARALRLSRTTVRRRAWAWLSIGALLAVGGGCGLAWGIQSGAQRWVGREGLALALARLIPEPQIPEPKPWCEPPGRPIAGWRASIRGHDVARQVADHLHREGVPRPGRVARVLVEHARTQDLDPILVLAMIDVESGFRPGARSSAGALGLLQVLPATGRDVAEELGVAWRGPATLLDPETNLRLGIVYFAKLLDRFDDLEHALAAYNFGPEAIRRSLSGGHPIPREYVRRVFGTYQDLRLELGDDSGVGSDDVADSRLDASTERGPSEESHAGAA